MGVRVPLRPLRPRGRSEIPRASSRSHTDRQGAAFAAVTTEFFPDAAAHAFRDARQEVARPPAGPGRTRHDPHDGCSRTGRSADSRRVSAPRPAAPLPLAICVTALLAGGCTHRQLARSTALTAGTVVDIQYETVLNNLARMSCNPGDLPSHIDLADGVVQVSDEASFGRAGGFDALDVSGAGGFGIDRYGPAAGRQISEQWGADATTDPQRLVDLQDLYRAALGLDPLPPPLAIALLRRDDERSGRNLDAGEPSAPEGLAGPDPEGGGSGSGSSGGSSGSGGSSSGSRRVPIEVLLADVPQPGWFGIGCKDDVPDCACHVGRHGDRYVWVTPHGLPDLSRFTVTVLAVVKFEPGPTGGGSSGLVVTP